MDFVHLDRGEDSGPLNLRYQPPVREGQGRAGGGGRSPAGRAVGPWMEVRSSEPRRLVSAVGC